MKVKTTTLEKQALNYAVHVARAQHAPQPERGLIIHQIGYAKDIPDYSTAWSAGGPIIEREGISVLRRFDVGGPYPQLDFAWWACGGDPGEEETLGLFGHTPLIAAMRCYVASKLGAEVEIPEELK